MSNQNQTAFPRYSYADGEGCSTPGLTKREFFAILALQGLLSGEDENYNFGATNCEKHPAESAVAHADALIKALDARGAA